MTASSALSFVMNAGWQVTLVALAGVLADRLMRTAPARFRHFTYFVALVASLATTAAAAALPARLHVRISRPALVMPRGWVTILLVTAGLAIVWRCARLIRAAWQTVRIARMPRVELPASALAVTLRAASTLGVAKPVVVAADIAGPVTLGLVSPLIIVPQALTRVGSEELLASAIGHELAHVRRRDFLSNLLLELILLPIAFHPAAWFLKRRIDEIRELACDELVVATRLIEPRSYARSLLRLAEAALTAAPSGYAMGAVAPPLLVERVHRLLDGPRVGGARRAAICLPMLCAVGALALPAHAAFTWDRTVPEWRADGVSACAAGDATIAQTALRRLDEYGRADVLVDCAAHGVSLCDGDGTQEQP